MKIGTEHGLFIFIVDIEVCIKELGEYLKQTRVNNGVSITEACEDLDFSTSQLENIESGNVKAFKDIYELKDDIKAYAKYLGLDSDKVVDEFNGFLFQHTSRISLDDIASFQKEKEKDQEKEPEKKRIQSPYTKEYKPQKNYMPIIGLIIGVFLLAGILYFILYHKNEEPNRIDELQTGIKEEGIYEFA